MTEAQQRYERDEYNRMVKHMNRLLSLPSYERLENSHDLIDSLKDVEHYINSVEHLLAGNYGYGPYKHIWDIVENHPQMNHVARVAKLVAAYEFNVGHYDAIKAYKKLTPKEQSTINNAIQKSIDEYVAERSNNDARPYA